MKSALTCAAIVFLATATIVAAQTSTTLGFPPHIATVGPFSDISQQVSLGASVPLRVSSLVDWRNQKTIDIVGVREDNPSCIEVRMWTPDTGSVTKGGKFSRVLSLTAGCTNESAKVYTAATAVDINRDGLLDIVATHGTNVDLILQQAGTDQLKIQTDVLKFPPQMGSTALLKDSSVNVINYFGQCAGVDIAATNSDGTMIIFRNALDTAPNTGGIACTNENWAAPANVTFVPELGTIVTNIVPAGTATVDLDGDCAAEFVFATRNPATRMMEIRAAPLAARNIHPSSTKKPSSPSTSSPSSASSASAFAAARNAGALEVDGEDNGKTDGLETDTTLIMTVPDDFGPPTWSDFDGDGAIDVAFAVCVAPLTESEAKQTTSTASPGASDLRSGTKRGAYKIVNCTSPNNYTGVLVVLNVNSGVCPKSECCGRFDFFSFASITRDMKDLPVSAMLSAITDHISSGGGSAAANSVASSSASSSSSNLADSSSPSPSSSCVLRSADPSMVPLKVRPGDYNDDGKCDAVVSSSCGPLVLRNTGDGHFVAILLATADSTGVMGEDSATDLNMLSDESSLPFFFDINDDGRLDVIVTHLGNFSACSAAANPNNNTATTTTFIRTLPLVCRGGVFVFWHRSNNEDNTNYFITATTLNAAKNLPSAAWGAVQPGATVRFQHLDIDNDVHSAGGTQLRATGYFELALARPHFGIGLTFASVMGFASGFQMDGKVYARAWPSVYLTPNSQILCVPYPVRDLSQWVVRLYLIGDWDLELVLIAWLVSLTVIGVPILALGVREVHEDRRSSGLAA